MTMDAPGATTAGPWRLVLDTNVWLDVLVFADAQVAALRAALEGDRVEAFTDPSCADELQRVLAYPLGRFTLQAAARERAWTRFMMLAHFWHDATPVSGRRDLPRCTDPDDQRFLELSLACGAHALVTRDRALLRLGGARHGLPFEIVGPAADFPAPRRAGDDAILLRWNRPVRPSTLSDSREQDATPAQLHPGSRAQPPDIP